MPSHEFKCVATSNLGTGPSFDLSSRLLELGEMTMVQSTPSPWMLRVTPLARASSDRMEGALRPKRPSSAASEAGDIKTSHGAVSTPPKEGWNLESLKGRGAPQ